MAVILLCWAFGGERERQDWIMPLVYAGTALSAVMIEPIYDNTLLYWYPMRTAWRSSAPMSGRSLGTFRWAMRGSLADRPIWSGG